MRHLLFAAFSSTIILLFQPAAAQDIDGNDTPGNWVVTHHAIYDIWNVLCDERDEAGTPVQRCYLRYVDVFSPRPKFAAQFLFITPGPKIDFGMEPGTLFLPGDFRIERQGTAVWQTNWPGCLTGLTCKFEGDDAKTLVTEMLAGDGFRFTFRDRHGQAQDLTWALSEFPRAWADFEAQSHTRGLLP